MKRGRHLIPFLILAVIAAFFYAGLYRDPGQIPSPLIGERVPDFRLPGVRDPAQEVSTGDLLGRLTLLNVWGTWCAECYREHGFLLQLAENSGIPIYGFNHNDERVKAIRWLDSLGDPYVRSAFDDDGLVAIDWGIYGAPETFLIGPDGRVLHKHISPLTPDVWERDFLPVIIEVCQREECGIGGDP